MDGAVLEWIPDCEVRQSPSLVEQLLREVRELRQETAELRQELAEVRRENLELRQQVGYWKAMYSRAAERVKVLEADVEQLRGENRKLQARLFGQKSEQSTSRDRSNRLDGENDDQAPSLPGKRGQRSGVRDPGGGITSICQLSKNFTNCPKTNASARNAEPQQHPATPKIPLSPCERLGGGPPIPSDNGFAECLRMACHNRLPHCSLRRFPCRSYSSNAWRFCAEQTLD